MKNHSRFSCLAVGAMLLASVSMASASTIFADWTTDTSGTLGAATITMTGATRTDLNVLNQTFSGFASAVFTPSVALTDTVGMWTKDSITLTFGLPVDLTLHIWQLANTRLNFDHSYSLVSSDGNFTAVSPTIIGISGPTDANGSLYFGTVSSLSWFPGPEINTLDGMRIQLSTVTNDGPTAVPEPASLVLLGTGLAAVARRRMTKRT